MEYMQSLLSVENLISGLAGVIVSLVTYKFGFLGKKEWFGNDCSVWVGILSLLAVIVLLYFGLYGYIPCVLLIPGATVVVRWYWLGKRKKELLKSKDALDNDIKRYEYYEWLSKKDLFRWEVKRFLLPAMNILFEIGTIRKLDEELDRLDSYKDWYEWKRLKSYVLWNKHEYREVIDLMKSYENDKHLTDGERARTTINLFGAYRNLEDQEGIRLYIKKLEDLIYVKKSYWVEAFDDLMYYYDEQGDQENADRLAAIIKGLNLKDFHQLLEVYDVLYFYNRRHGKTQANRELLDMMVEKSSMMTDKERKMIFEVRLLKLYFENDYGWKEYSIKLYNDADRFLNYSCRVAFEYLRAVNMVVQDSRLHILGPGVGIMALYDKILKRIGGYVEAFDKELIELPDDFLYRKKEMLMLKVEYLKAKANEQMDFKTFVKDMRNTIHKIIALCEKKGDEREKVHFLMVLADEMVAFKDDVLAVKNGKPLTPQEQEAFGNLSDEDMDVAEREAIECVQEMDQILKKHHYERTMAYNIFYAAYLNMKLNNMGMAREMMARFHDTGVDIRHYTLGVQRLYDEVVEALA